MNLLARTQLTRQLATLFHAGVPLARCLATFPGTEGLVQALHSGLPFSQALRREGFPEGYVQAVAVGERTGALALVLERLASELERQDRLRRKTLAALTYPALMLGMGVLLWLLFTFLLLPVLDELFGSLGLSLPLLTRLVLGFGHVLRSPLVLVPVLLVPLSLWLSRDALRAWLRESPAGMSWHRFWLRLPVLDRREASRLLYLLALLIDSGCRLSDALDMLVDLSDNRVLAAQLAEVRRQVYEGARLSDALQACQVLRPDALSLLNAGEESSRLAAMAVMAARLNDLEADHQTEVLTALAEPVLMSVLGLASGVLFIAVLLPISQLVAGVG